MLDGGTLLGDAGEPPMMIVLGYTCGTYSTLSAPSRLAFHGLCTRVMLLDQGLPSACPLLEALAEPFPSILLDRQVSASLFCCSSLGNEPFGGLGYHQVVGAQPEPRPLGQPLMWREHGQMTLLWLEHLLTSPWVWALILAWNFILTELIPDCFRLQKLVSDKAVFNKDIRGKELCWLDRALPCWALLCQMRRRRSPPSALPSCSLAEWWSRRHNGGGG